MPEEKITSLQNQNVKNAVNLRERKHRDETGLTIVEGVREILQAQKSSVEFKEIYVCKELFADRGKSDVLAQIDSSQVKVFETTKEVFEKISYGDRREGVIAVCSQPHLSLEDLQLQSPPFVIVLERVEKPGNVGAILRSCDGAGVGALILCDPMTDVYNPNVIRASIGTVFSLPVVQATNEETLKFLTDRKIRACTTLTNASTIYTNVDYTKSTAIVLGSEKKGVSEFWEENTSHKIHVPMHGIADSLNVSITAAVVIYEALRQRTG